MDFSQIQVDMNTLAQLTTSSISKMEEQTNNDNANTLSFAEICEQELKQNQIRMEAIAQKKWNEEKTKRTNICDYKHQRAEILLCGYFRRFRDKTQRISILNRNIMNMTDYLPPLVITLCYSYYCYAPIIDKWVDKGKDVEINSNGQLATFSSHKNWQSVFGEISALKGKHKWNVEILEIGDGVILGIKSITKYERRENKKFVIDDDKPFHHYRSYGFGIENDMKCIIYKRNNNDILEGFVCSKQENFVMTILLDFNDKKVSFFKNGEFVITINNIRYLSDDARSYCLAVSGWKNCRVNLLSYQKLTEHR